MPFPFSQFPYILQESILSRSPLDVSLQLLTVNHQLRSSILFRGPFPKNIHSIQLTLDKDDLLSIRIKIENVLSSGNPFIKKFLGDQEVFIREDRLSTADRSIWQQCNEISRLRNLHLRFLGDHLATGEEGSLFKNFSFLPKVESLAKVQVTMNEYQGWAHLFLESFPGFRIDECHLLAPTPLSLLTRKVNAKYLKLGFLNQYEFPERLQEVMAFPEPIPSQIGIICIQSRSCSLAEIHKVHTKIHDLQKGIQKIERLSDQDPRIGEILYSVPDLGDNLDLEVISFLKRQTNLITFYHLSFLSTDSKTGGQSIGLVTQSHSSLPSQELS